MCFSNMQNILQSSPDGNVTLSILNYVPCIRDAGKYMACRAKNSELPDATITISDRLFSPLILIFCYKKRPVPTLLRIFIDFWLANMCFSKVQNILQSSPDGKVTLSILNYCNVCNTNINISVIQNSKLSIIVDSESSNIGKKKVLFTVSFVVREPYYGLL